MRAVIPIFNPRADRRGFVLIELLVAITVLGLVAAPVLTAFITGYTSLAEAGDKTGALNLARRQMEEVKSMGYPAAHLYYVEQGKSPQVTREGLFTLETRVTPEPAKINSSTGEGTRDLPLLKIVITVSGGKLPGKRPVQLVSCLSSR